MLVSLEMASLLSKTSQERPSLACKYTVSMETSAWSPVLGAPWLWPQRCLGSTESASLAWKEEICATPRLFADNPQEGQVKQGLLGDCWFLCACAALQKSRHLLDQVPGSWGSSMPSLCQICESSRGGLARASCCCAFRIPGAGVAGRGPGERGAKGGAGWTQPMSLSCCPSCRKESSGWRRKSSSRSLTRSPLASRSRRPATCRASTQERRCATLRSCLGPGSRGSRQEAVGTTAAFPATPSSGCGSQNRARCLPLSCRDPGCAPQARQAGLGLRWGTGLPRGARPASWVEKRRVSLPRVLSTPPVAGTVCHAYDREVHLRCELTPGYYLAVPSTFLKDVPAQFLLRVFSSGRVSLSAIKSAAGSPAPGEALPAGEWETVQLRGSWRTGQTAGGSRNFASYPSNPCFPLSVPEGPGPRCVRVTLRQHCQDTQCHPIGFHVFQVPGTGGSQAAPGLLLQEPVLSCVPHRYAQEVSRLCHLSAGAYRIVPSTYLPDTEGAFTVTIATRIDRWGSRARGSSVYGVHRPVVAPAPTCPGGTAGEHVSLQGPGRRTRPFLELGASRATLFSLLQALHSQPGEAGAAPSGGLLHGS
uniref:Calpain-10 isoform X9 n=1 Tax=Callorhinus ursinus TaxID=34884 RepID=A0A3Q7QCH5_CALUR|nr:calpain-10 isoform X9 [Callorhinus ursinus]